MQAEMPPGQLVLDLMDEEFVCDLAYEENGEKAVQAMF